MSEDKADRPRVASSLADYLDDELTGLPDVLDVHQAAEQIAALFAANEGATFNLYSLRMPIPRSLLRTLVCLNLVAVSAATS